MIEVDNIVKTFGPTTVINGLSFSIGKGTIFGLLGPNGAGKTTLIRMLCGILQNDSGRILINGKTVEKAKHEFGYVSQSFGQYEELTVWENIVFYAQMYRISDKKRLEMLLKRYSLDKYKKHKAGTLSGGYKRRLALACALAHDPLVLFLDEPTAGIDPITRKLLWDDFYALSVEGKTLFVTTHYMEEAQRCHELAFLASGHIVAQGTPESIKNTLGDIRLYTVKLAYSPKISLLLGELKGILLLNQFGDELRIMVTKGCDIAKLKHIVQEQLSSRSPLEEGSVNLEDIFIALTQEKAL